MKAYSSFNTRTSPVTEPILGEKQIVNNTGGFVYEVSKWTMLQRFLILGSEGGSYYATEQKLTKDNAFNVLACIAEDGPRAVRQILEVSNAGRALKNDPAIFALALAASASDAKTRAIALDAVRNICRIPTHLFHFLTFVQQFRGWGRGLKRTIAEWYSSRDLDPLAYTMTKYQSRDGFSQRDALRLCHVKTDTSTAEGIKRNNLYKWAVDGYQDVWHQGGAVPDIITGFELAKTAPDAPALIKLIKQYNLSREHLPTEALTYPEVWDALLPNMGYTAMIRNLGNLSKVGLLTSMSDASRMVARKLNDLDSLKQQRVHPMAILVAMKQYECGHGLKGKGTWTPVQSVVDCLNDAFYNAFQFVAPTGKRFVFGVDVSGSMSCGETGVPNLTPREAAAAMALAVAKTEREYVIMGFSRTFVNLPITPNMRLTDAVRVTNGLPFSTTDCSLPMSWARKEKLRADVFVVLTDNETNYGEHPKQALRAYREWSGIAAKQVVMAMTPTKFSVADPADPLTMDIAGTDASAPVAIQEFAKL